MKRKLKGKLGINRWSGEDQYITIELTDGSTGLQLFEVEMTMGAFAQAVTGLSYVNVEFQLGKTKFAGFIPERKTLWLEEGGSLDQYLIYGWRVARDDRGNPHYRKDNTFPVHFVRYHAPEEEPDGIGN